MTEIEYRIEHDAMGEVRVPKNALYAAQTQRAVENFPISGKGIERLSETGVVLSDGTELPADLVIYATGYSPDPVRCVDGAVFIRKPYLPTAIVAAANDLMAKGP